MATKKNSDFFRASKSGIFSSPPLLVAGPLKKDRYFFAASLSQKRRIRTRWTKRLTFIQLDPTLIKPLIEINYIKIAVSSCNHDSPLKQCMIKIQIRKVLLKYVHGVLSIFFVKRLTIWKWTILLGHIFFTFHSD